MKKLLWIEDESFMIRSLFRPLERDGIDVEIATSAAKGFYRCQKWQQYDAIVLDLIIPISDKPEKIPSIVMQWEKEMYVGIGLAKWLLVEAKVRCPVVVLSINRPSDDDNLINLGLAGYISKNGLLPSQLRKQIMQFLELPKPKT